MGYRSWFSGYDGTVKGCDEPFYWTIYPKVRNRGDSSTIAGIDLQVTVRHKDAVEQEDDHQDDVVEKEKVDAPKQKLSSKEREKENKKRKKETEREKKQKKQPTKPSAKTSKSEEEDGDREKEKELPPPIDKAFEAHADVEDECFTLVFDNRSDLADLTITVTHEGSSFSGAALSRDAKDRGDDDRVHSNVALSKPWTLVIVVEDKRPKGVDLDPLPLAGVAVTSSWSTAKDGTCTKAGRSLDESYPLEVDVAGLSPARSTFQVTTTFPSTEDDFLEELDDEVGDEEDGGEELAHLAECSSPGATVTVTFRLAFEQVFIAGEGTGWGYAAGLARKYQDPSSKSGRRWIFASQYDVTAPDGFDDVKDDNLFVYRTDAGEKGRFDVTIEKDWTDLAEEHGAFDALLFNNPHPGYGLHQCVVFGTTSQGPLRYRGGKYVSVHTLDYQGTISSGTLTDDPGDHFDYVKNTLGHTCKFDTATFPDFANGSVGISAAFQYAEKQLEQRSIDKESFPTEKVHYRAKKTTLGLLEHVLTSYVKLGQGVLRGGGELYVNGSVKHEGHLLPLGMKNEEAWQTHGKYFAKYTTNLTDPKFHPSHLAKGNFVPKQPPLENARVFLKVK